MRNTPTTDFSATSSGGPGATGTVGSPDAERDVRKWMLRWVLAGLALAMLIYGTATLWSRPEPVTAENYARVHKGMTRAEVEANLGPPGNYETGRTPSADKNGFLPSYI